MTAAPPDADPSSVELADLRTQILQLQETLNAISGGGVDAVVLGPPDQEQVYTLTGADRPYRVLVESMGEGAATVSESGVILYANRQLAELVGVERDSMVGRDLMAYVGEAERTVLESLLTNLPAAPQDPDGAEPGSGPDPPSSDTRRAELIIARPDGSEVAVLVAATPLDLEGALVRCLVLTDLTLQKQVERQTAAESALAERQRVAREVNDTIVQGLVTAEMAIDLEKYGYARKVIATTSLRARRWIGELAVDHPLEPGTAVRSTPAGPGEPR